jgi:hypothetical protein
LQELAPALERIEHATGMLEKTHIKIDVAVQMALRIVQQGDHVLRTA